MSNDLITKPEDFFSDQMKSILFYEKKLLNQKNAIQYVEKILNGSKIDDIVSEIKLINSSEKEWIANSLNKKGMIKENLSSGNNSEQTQLNKQI